MFRSPGVYALRKRHDYKMTGDTTPRAPWNVTMPKVAKHVQNLDSVCWAERTAVQPLAACVLPFFLSAGSGAKTPALAARPKIITENGEERENALAKGG
mmetsp:Transcript_50441/g.81469  ORF Transcript_50441/g.81469 Transcript_50441/m.81469 type:complete len:99 (-) Transcript_50441:45-341(-)